MNNKLKIVIEDGLAIQNATGIAQYTINLLNNLKLSHEINGVKILEKTFLRSVPSAALRRMCHIVWLNSYLPLYLKNESVDILHCTNYLIPSVKLAKTKYAVTIHDLTAWQFPDTLPKAYREFNKWSIRLALKKADVVFTVSEAVKTEIIKLFKVDGKKISTVFNGISNIFWELSKKTTAQEADSVKKKYGITKDYLLFVGTLEERKNIITLLKAFTRLKNIDRLQLVCVGKQGYRFHDINKYLEENELDHKVIMTGFVPEREMVVLYDLAKVFVYPSLYEGFGIPLVEAMARGLPIVASKIPASEEVAKDVAIFYGDPLEHELLANCLSEVLENDPLRLEMIGNSLKRAQDFSWEKLTNQYIEIYKAI